MIKNSFFIIVFIWSLSNGEVKTFIRPLINRFGKDPLFKIIGTDEISYKALPLRLHLVTKSLVEGKYVGKRD